MKTLVLLIIWILMSLWGSGSNAQKVTANGYFEITGLVIEETMTPAGHNLYESFNARWKPMEGLSYTITVNVITSYSIHYTKLYE